MELQKGDKINSPKYIKELSQILRKNMTDSEKMLWSKLRRKQHFGMKFRRQNPIGRYIADFYCHELKLIIEVDGKIHDTRKEYDKNRDSFLKAGEYNFLRFNNNEIEKSLDEVLEKIHEFSMKI